MASKDMENNSISMFNGTKFDCPKVYYSLKNYNSDSDEETKQKVNNLKKPCNVKLHPVRLNDNQIGTFNCTSHENTIVKKSSEENVFKNNREVDTSTPQINFTCEDHEKRVSQIETQVLFTSSSNDKMVDSCIVKDMSENSDCSIHHEKRDVKDNQDKNNIDNYCDNSQYATRMTSCPKEELIYNQVSSESTCESRRDDESRDSVDHLDIFARLRSNIDQHTINVNNKMDNDFIKMNLNDGSPDKQNSSPKLEKIEENNYVTQHNDLMDHTKTHPVHDAVSHESDLESGLASEFQDRPQPSKLQFDDVWSKNGESNNVGQENYFIHRFHDTK